jgi:hypothetical protein
MKTTHRLIKMCRRIGGFFLLFAGLSLAFAAETAPPDSSAALQKLQEQLDQQTKRIDRLYRAFGPQLEELEERAAELEKLREEDKALAMERICEVKDDSLAGIGSINPAAAEFGVLTDTGSVRIFDDAGKVVRDIRSEGQPITCFSFSPNGKELLAGTKNGALLIWDLASNDCTSLCTNVGQKVDRVTWLGNDRVAWGAFRNFWDENAKEADRDKPAGAVLTRAGGKVLWTYRSLLRDDFYSLTGTKDGSSLIVHDIPGQARGASLLDGKTGEIRQTCYDEDHGSGPLSLGISPNNKILAVGYAPYDIILWNAQNGDQKKLLKGHSNWVVSLAFSSDGKRLISGAGDSTARVWDVDSGKEIGRLRFDGSSTYVEGVGLTPKGDVVFAVARGILVVAKAPPVVSFTDSK